MTVGKLEVENEVGKYYVRSVCSMHTEVIGLSHPGVVGSLIKHSNSASICIDVNLHLLELSICYHLLRWRTDTPDKPARNHK